MSPCRCSHMRASQVGAAGSGAHGSVRRMLRPLARVPENMPHPSLAAPCQKNALAPYMRTCAGARGAGRAHGAVRFSPPGWAPKNVPHPSRAALLQEDARAPRMRTCACARQVGAAGAGARGAGRARVPPARLRRGGHARRLRRGPETGPQPGLVEAWHGHAILCCSCRSGRV